MGTRRVLREPTVPILLAASVAHVVRRNVFDLVVFAGTAMVIVIDSRRRATVTGDARGWSANGLRSRTWLAVAGMTLLAAIAALAPPASFWARLVMVVVGLIALAIVLRQPRRARGRRVHDDQTDPSGQLAGWPVWAAIGVAACLWELASFIAQQVWPADEDEHPAVSDLVGPLLETWLGRAIFLLLWAGAGWWLLRELSGGAARRPARTTARNQGVGECGGPGNRRTGSAAPPIGSADHGGSRREAGR